MHLLLPARAASPCKPGLWADARTVLTAAVHATHGKLCSSHVLTAVHTLVAAGQGENNMLQKGRMAQQHMTAWACEGRPCASTPSDAHRAYMQYLT